MKIVTCLLASASGVSLQDDTSTLLSLRNKAQTKLSVGLDLLESVGSRNVTQMSALLEDLVEETISEDSSVQFDGEVAAALDMIKRALIVDIRGALQEAHCQNQNELHRRILCFEDCNNARKEGADSCGASCDGSAHRTCRGQLLNSYKEYVNTCNTLDDYVSGFPGRHCPQFEQKCCSLERTTWNSNFCSQEEGAECESKIDQLKVDGSTGVWLENQIVLFRNKYQEWQRLRDGCRDAHRAYVEKDAECDCAQAECETRNCEWESCHYLNCDDDYNKCWGNCETEFRETNKAMECLEKDRKIDWSATEKIECYINILLEKPSNETLLAECGTTDCHNVYRKRMYASCNHICPEVDFEGQRGHHARREQQSIHDRDDLDVTGAGDGHTVYTRHRGAGENSSGRCTSHLDLDYQHAPCCHQCDLRPSPPCEDDVSPRADARDFHASIQPYSEHESYKWLQYKKFDYFSQDQIPGLEPGHTLAYAYNLCDCNDCSVLRSAEPPVCTESKACGAEHDDDAFYRKHDSIQDCSVFRTDSGPYDPLVATTVAPYQ